MSEKASKRELKSVIAIAFPAIYICAVLIGVFHSGAALHICPARAAHYNITVEVEGTTIHYQKQSFWEESEFSEILENKEEFENVVIHCLNEDLSRYGERGEYATGAEVIIDEKKKATVLKCDIHGAISESEGEYYATFKWLLVPLGLDFIDDNFKESKEGLSWEGEVGGIQTGITIKLPPQESVYEAWKRPVGHCHGHVWWVMPVPSPTPSPLITPPAPTPSPAVATPTPPGFEMILAIAGMLGVAYLIFKMH